MSEWTHDDEPTGSELRKMYEKALKELKAVKSERDGLVQEKATASASQALQAKGYNPSVARFAAADGIDLTDEASLSKWLDDNKDVFKPTATQPESSNEDDPNPPADPAFTGDVVDAFAAVQRVHSAGTSDLRNKYESAMASLPEDASPQQVAAHFRAQGL